MGKMPNSQPQTWSENVLIPLVQNVIGGMAVSALAAVSTAFLFNSSTYVTCGFTTIRFFGDDLGLFSTAFRAGQKSQQSEIDRLSDLLYDAQSLIEKMESDPKIEVGTTRNHQQILDAVADAEKIIRWAFDGHSISRAACGRRGMKQRAWERANKVIHNAGIVRDGRWTHGSRSEAMKALKKHFDRRSKQSKSSNIVTPY